ncbi:MAG TPA: NUDIX domain-containing protein [Gammaproteobacteria bacterium]|nr:NUDIX domain-containing protein [Gammaproteobacteria bacterium]
MPGSTHSGGVVFRLTKSGPRYLLVGASGSKNRWVLPKGNIEKGESAAAAAVREVAEEAGVRTRLIQRLKRVKQKKGDERITVVYYLLVYSGRTSAAEDRVVRWCTLDEALDAVDVPRVRRLLKSTDRLLTSAMRERPAVRVWRIFEWALLGAVVLLAAAPIWRAADVPRAVLAVALALLVLPLGFALGSVLRRLVPPVERRLFGSLESEGPASALPSGEDRLRLLVRGPDAVEREDFLGTRFRVSGALALFAPVTALSLPSWLSLVLFALAIGAWWFVGRRRALVVAALAGGNR